MSPAFVAGARMVYFSEAKQRYFQCAILNVNAASGAVTIDLKPEQPLTAEQAGRCLRALPATHGAALIPTPAKSATTEPSSTHWTHPHLMQANQNQQAQMAPPGQPHLAQPCLGQPHLGQPQQSPVPAVGVSIDVRRSAASSGKAVDKAAEKAADKATDKAVKTREPSGVGQEGGHKNGRVEPAGGFIGGTQPIPEEWLDIFLELQLPEARAQRFWLRFEQLRGKMPLEDAWKRAIEEQLVEQTGSTAKLGPAAGEKPQSVGPGTGPQGGSVSAAVPSWLAGGVAADLMISMLGVGLQMSFAPDDQ